jgi:glutamyl-tRNA synthetase/glutamyl-Q tRNA(Asp) synthetase
VWTWGVARARAGRVLLRLEDHDRGRWRPEYETQILDDLTWLGLVPDEESTRRLRDGPSSFRQSDNDLEYERALGRLRERDAVYVCQCSRKTIAEGLADEPDPVADELRYPGTCRALGLEPAPGRGIRVALSGEPVRFDDVRLGPIEQRPIEQCGDLLVRDPTGNWTYQFCVVVDDLRHGVDLVVRGEDILASTGRQILLREMLGAVERPLYLHHPLILGEAGEKLSKRAQSLAVRDLRSAGVAPEVVLGEAAYRTGLLPEPESLPASRLGALFGA